MREKLLGKTLEEMKQAAVECGLKAFVGKQLCEWLYVKRVTDWDRMVNVSKASRQALAERYDLGAAAPCGRAESVDGTVKYLFPVECPRPEGAETSCVEAVVIPDADRRTLCVSSQAGCRMGCRFCMTGRQGFHGNLSAADILAQFLGVDDPEGLTNAVFMGMGEPLDNYGAVSRALEVLTAPWGFAWSPKRITLSTVGDIPNLRRYLDEFRCHLALSVHNPFGEERFTMMPVQKAWPLRDVLDLIRKYDFTSQRRVSFEYTMFDGWNDSPRHAEALSRLLEGLECRVNLIRFHRIPDFPYGTAPAASMDRFRRIVESHGITCTLRASRGEDILAACGMLAGKHS